MTGAILVAATMALTPAKGLSYSLSWNLPPPKPILLRVPDQYPSVQAALPYLADGGVIEVTSNLTGNQLVNVGSMQFTLRGSSRAVTLSAASGVVVDVQQCGGVTIENLTISGGSYGVRLAAHIPATVRDLTIRSSAIGVGVHSPTSWSPRLIYLDGLAILGATSNGVQVLGGRVDIQGLVVTAAYHGLHVGYHSVVAGGYSSFLQAKVGVWVGEQGRVSLTDVRAAYNSWGGFAFEYAGPSELILPDARYNRYNGIRVENSPQVLIDGAYVTRTTLPAGESASTTPICSDPVTFSLPGGGTLAYQECHLPGALASDNSGVDVRNSTVVDNDTGAVLLRSSDVGLRDNDLESDELNVVMLIDATRIWMTGNTVTGTTFDAAAALVLMGFESASTAIWQNYLNGYSYGVALTLDFRWITGNLIANNTFPENLTEEVVEVELPPEPSPEMPAP